MKTLNQKNKQIEKQPLEYYLNLQYPVILYPDPEGGYVAQIKDLPGCLTQGETLDETVANINEARELWIETAYEFGDDIPLPSTEETYRSKLLLRTEQKQSLVETAAEIQNLLQQLQEEYPTNTPVEKGFVVTEALKQIESNPTFQARLIAAIKAGGIESLKELVDNRLINIFVASLEGWQETE